MPTISPVRSAVPARAEEAAGLENLLRSAHRARGRRREQLLDEAIVAGIPLARTLAGRYHGRGVDGDDIDQVAFEYLVKAVHNYHPTDGSDFRSYALPTIRGGIRHHFRDHAWAVKLPRRMQETQARINAVQVELAATLQRWPTSRELADVLHLEVAEVIEAEQARGCFQPASLDSPVQGHDPRESLGQLMADPTDTFQLVDQVQSLLPVVNSLPARDRHILQRRFVDHYTQAEIGSEIGVSQMQVSRLLRNIMQQLRLALSA